MKSKKEIFCVVLLWGMVAYAITLLAFCTLKYIFHLNSEFISAFSSFLSAIAAFFAAFVASYLFTDWKEQAKYEFNKECSMKILEHISTLRYNLSTKIDALEAIRRIKIFAVIRDELKHYKFEDDEILVKQFFLNRHHSLALKTKKLKHEPRISSLYTEISKYYMHIITPYSLLIYDYNNYQEKLLNEIDPIKLNYNYNKINRSYALLGINGNFYLKTRILKRLNTECGFVEYDNNGDIINEVIEENLHNMINTTLVKLDNLENELIKINNFNEN